MGIFGKPKPPPPPPNNLGGGIIAAAGALIGLIAAVPSIKKWIDEKWENSNMILDPESRYYSSYISGMKTGFTTPAGNCLLSYAQVNGRRFLIGIFECKYPEDRFADTLLLLMRIMGQPVPTP